ncbi:calcium-binding protein [Streptomyces sp. NPDC047971]|uniref:calcium-binding protein n=1 Tax=Streptomyces sp. NPDC047971 TaxID=3154499 RepID=UPI00340D50DA
MRLRALFRTGLAATLAVGGLATAALVAPSAQAATGNLRITKVVVNGGKDIVLGTAAKQVTVTATISEDSPLTDVWLDLEQRFGDDVRFHVAGRATCSGSGTVKTCSRAFTLDPRSDMITSRSAGPNGWVAYAQVDAKDGDFQSGYFPSVALRRQTVVTMDAGPEPVRKGAALTAYGRLTAANWDTNTWTGLSGQSVQLQYCANPCKAYTTVRTVKTNSTGHLKSSVTASADGYWRWYYPATTWAQPYLSNADFIDVR